MEKSGTLMLKVLHIGLCVYKGKDSSLTNSFKRHCDVYAECDLEHVNGKAPIIAKTLKPDIVFFQIQADNVVSLETARKVKEHSAFVVNWTGDVRQPTPNWFLPFGKEIDLTLFTNETDVKYCNKHGVKADFLQIGYDETIYYPPTFELHIPKEGLKYAGLVPSKKDIEIVFMGNNYTNMFPLSAMRIEMVKRLKRRYGQRFKVFGNNWGKFGDGNYNHSQHEEAAIYRRSKLAINLSHYDLPRYSSDRMLRIMGCGVTCLTHDFKDIDKDFPEGTVVKWQNLRDLEKQIDYYLENETDIGAKGEELVRTNWTFDCMVKNLIKIYEKH